MKYELETSGLQFIVRRSYFIVPVYCIMHAEA